MKLLIDIGHPAHVHLFHNLARDLEQHGYTVLFTSRDKEHTLELLKHFGLSYISFGRPYRKGICKVIGLIIFNAKMLVTLLKYKPDITLSHGSMYAAQMSWLLGIPHISLEDTGNMEQIMLYKPFTKAILVPNCFNKTLGNKQIAYDGNHELAYLHPLRFIPDPSVLDELQVKPGKKYVLLRFIAWNASHDRGHKGLSMEIKQKAIDMFSQHARIFISSEAPLPSEFEKYRLNTKPERLHDVIAFSSLLYGESATLASEACLLGVPAIYLDNTGRCYTKEEEEKYGMVFNFTESEEDQEKSVHKGVELLAASGIREEWEQRKLNMLNDKIDVTAFLSWFIEKWPESMKIMKETPSYQDRFR